MEVNFKGTDTTYYYNTDEDGHYEFRTNEKGTNREVLMGQSWESCREPHQSLLDLHNEVIKSQNLQ